MEVTTMATNQGATSGEPSRINNCTIGDAWLIRYEDGDITIHEHDEGRSDRSEDQIVLVPGQLATLTREWPIDEGSPLYLGEDDLGRAATVERLDADTVTIENSESAIELSAETVASVVNQLDYWNYDQYAAGSADRVELDADHVQSLLRFAADNHPRDGIGWIGEFASALIEAELELYDRVITVHRDNLGPIVEFLSDDVSMTRQSEPLRNVNHRLNRFGTDRVPVDRNHVESLLEDARDKPTDSTLREAIAGVEDALDE